MSRRYYLDSWTAGGRALERRRGGGDPDPPSVGLQRAFLRPLRTCGRLGGGTVWVEVTSRGSAQVPIRRCSDLVEQAVSWANRTKFGGFGGGRARRDRGFIQDADMPLGGQRARSVPSWGTFLCARQLLRWPPAWL